MPHPRLVAALAATVALAAAAPAADAQSKAAPAKLKVMTRNIYLGGNIFLPIPAKTGSSSSRRPASCGIR